MFGRPVPKEIVEKRGEPVRYWGARAIFHPGTKHPIDLLGDRQGCKCDEGLASKPLLDWLNTKGMKELQKMRAFNAFPPTVPRSSSSRMANSPSNAAPMPPTAISTSGLGSIGRRVAGTSRRNQTPRPSGAATNPSRPSARRSRPHQWTMARRRHRVFRRTRVSGHRGRLYRPQAARLSREARRRRQAGAVLRRRSDGVENG